MPLPDNWDKLTPNQRYEARFNSFKNPGLDFKNEAIKNKYQDSVQRLKDVVDLKKPDRVPIVPNIGFYPARYANISAEEAMYDYEKMTKAWRKFNKDFDFDYQTSCTTVGSAPVFDKLQFNLYRWPGNGTKPHTPYQCVEKEYMKADEYDDLINDPTGFFIRSYLPRIFGSMKSWSKLAPFTNLIELPFVVPTMMTFGFDDVQQSFEQILQAGKEALKWMQTVGTLHQEVAANYGLPATTGGFTKAPFDILGDTLRGTKDIMLDIYRRPEKIKEAMERLLPIAIEMGVSASSNSNNPFILIPLHKGADIFMTRDQFAEFYWPTLKKLIKGLTDQGCIPAFFVEGAYNQRLDFLADPDLPEGKIYWYFDKTDMVEVKKHLSGKAAFGGNVSASLIKAGTPEKVDNYVKELIENVASDGGYMLTTGAVIDDAEEENLRALISAGKKYGEYN